MLVVVGGDRRKVGKTLVAERLIRSLPQCRWVAVKVSPHLHNHGELPAEGWRVSEETLAAASGDTARYLAAGAARALFVETRNAAYPKVAHFLEQMASRNQCLLVESNRILPFLTPDFVIAVAATGGEAKPSARLLRRHTDATVLLPSTHSSADPLTAARVLCAGLPSDWETLCRLLAQRLT